MQRITILGLPLGNGVGWSGSHISLYEFLIMFDFSRNGFIYYIIYYTNILAGSIYVQTWEKVMSMNI